MTLLKKKKMKVRSRWSTAEIMKEADYAEHIAFLLTFPIESQEHRVEQAEKSTVFCMKVNKTKFMCFKWKEALSVT